VVGLANRGKGKWQFRTTGGWKTITGRVSDRRALLLPPTARLRFAPNAGVSPGRLRIRLRAWDQTVGTAGRFAAATPFGGTSAFGAAVRTVSTTVARSANAGSPTFESAAVGDDAHALSAAALDHLFGRSVDD
ncbi:MAG: hypothetical protein ACRC1K_07705, partial [Planctomycetia bacterium]